MTKKEPKMTNKEWGHPDPDKIYLVSEKKSFSTGAYR